MYKFDVEKATNDCVKWIQDFFENNGKGCKGVLGVSGGKDSSVVAALLVKALGKENVVGVLMPNGHQSDIDYAYEVCKFLDIKHYEINIQDGYNGLRKQIEENLEFTNQARINLAPRIRMATVYAVSQCVNGRVANTCNYSEDYVGYSTRYGDSAGDFAPIANFTVAEVVQMGKYLGLPERIYSKAPSDGLCGKTDEDNLGFTYDTLDKYLREGIRPEEAVLEKIERLHKINLFKLSYMPVFDYQPNKE